MPGVTSSSPALNLSSAAPQQSAETESESVLPQHPELPFPPLKRSHILNCSYALWHPRYRSHVPKCRIISLPQEFIDYLREDGIFLPPDDEKGRGLPRFVDVDRDTDDDNEAASRAIINDTERFSAIARDLRRGVDEISGRRNGEILVGNGNEGGCENGEIDVGENEEEEGEGGRGDNHNQLRSNPDYDPTERFKELHERIKATIEELGGRVTPKLNWSAPKDATWISPTNSLECRTPSDIYLLFKSSDFITHDLEHPFDNCINDLHPQNQSIQYTLILRKWFDINPSVEFRCFVRNRALLAITQRDLNHYEFLESMRDDLVHLIREFFKEKLRNTFPDPDFTFDVYIPRMQSRVWLIDINPFALRTDPILFSWLEILNLGPTSVEEGSPELRLVRKNDPEAYSFNTPQYSAHKLPKEVVDAGLGGAESIQEFAMRWRDIVNNMPDP